MKYFEVTTKVIELCRDTSLDFQAKVRGIQSALHACTKADLLDHLDYAGIIPECFGHDSTEEKVFAKYCDALLVKAYCEILDERGENAYWYKRESPTLEPWEKGHTINGTTFSQFRKIIIKQGWRVDRQVHKPIGSIGRNVERSKGARLLSTLFYPLTFIPGLQELFLHRNTFILTKEFA